MQDLVHGHSRLCHMHERDLCVVESVRGGNFAEAPDGGVFGSEALPRDWCMTATATLTGILTLTA